MLNCWLCVIHHFSSSPKTLCRDVAQFCTLCKAKRLVTLIGIYGYTRNIKNNLPTKRDRNTVSVENHFYSTSLFDPSAFELKFLIFF